MAPPLLLLGVRRSGTTLLRVMLDRNSRLAIPDESYFIPQLASRQRGRLDVDEFVDDLRRLPTIRDWEVPVEDVRVRIGWRGATLGDAIGAVYDVYAALRGKTRWGDKTPLYMQYLGLLDRLFPTATYAHLIRDGRDAAMSYLTVPAGIMTEAWGHPRDVTGFACQWRTEVAAARTLGRKVGPSRYLELRYESFVGDPEGQLRRLCSFAGLPYEPSMLQYVGAVDVSEKPHQRSLTMAPTPGLRNWRADMDAADVTAFERVAGDLLAELDYELADRETARGPGLGARMALAAYAAKGAAWRGAASGLQRSPLWHRRHPVLS